MSLGQSLGHFRLIRPAFRLGDAAIEELRRKFFAAPRMQRWTTGNI
jgi:hypothetical protein